MKWNLSENRQIIKTRDDREPILLEPSEGNSFKVSEGCSWAKSDEKLPPEKLRERIEPWLTALCQSEFLSMLIGSGLTHAVHYIAVAHRLPGMAQATFERLGNVINQAVKELANKAGRENGNFEDQIRVVNELICGLDILAHQIGDDKENKYKNCADQLRNELRSALESFANSILEGERSLAAAPDYGSEGEEKDSQNSSVNQDTTSQVGQEDLDQQEQKKNDKGGKGRISALNYLVSFLMSFASRTATRDRLHIFTTNYDRYIELGADLAGLRLIDRFVGTLNPIFRASRLNVDMHYNPPGIRGEPRYLEGVARFTKLHGSVDWIYSDGEVRRIGIPFGAENISNYLQAPGLKNASALELMIYPNPAKDTETLLYPYSELFRDFAAAICRPNSTLITYGYSFGDEHINRIIQDMLAIPSTHLVIISFDDPLGRIEKFYERVGRTAQITLLIGNHLANLEWLVDRYLPKPAIDRTTIRMANMIKARLGTQQQESQEQSSDNENASNDDADAD